MNSSDANESSIADDVILKQLTQLAIQSHAETRRTLEHIRNNVSASDDGPSKAEKDLLLHSSAGDQNSRSITWTSLLNELDHPTSSTASNNWEESNFTADGEHLRNLLTAQEAQEQPAVIQEHEEPDEEECEEADDGNELDFLDNVGWSEMVEFEKGPTQRGEKCIWNQGCKYLIRGRRPSGIYTYWKCSKWNQKCQASARIAKGQLGDVLRGRLRTTLKGHIIPHNHQPEDPMKQEAEEMRAEIKRKIWERPNITLDELLENVSEELLRAMNGRRNVGNMVTREKMKCWEAQDDHPKRRGNY